MLPFHALLWIMTPQKLTSPTASGETAITIKSTSPQISSSTTSTVAPRSMSQLCILIMYMWYFYAVHTNAHPSPSPVSDAISKYLVQYMPPPPAKKNTASTRVTGLRVLTSVQGFLLEKEEKKRKEKKGKGLKKTRKRTAPRKRLQ